VPPNRSSKRSPFSFIESRPPTPLSSATGKRIPRKRLWRTSALKYEHFKAQIKTPEDFIRLAATKSLLTGQPYLVRTRDGKEMPLNTWLTDALREHRQHDGN
jgi:hypothetical protein